MDLQAADKDTHGPRSFVALPPVRGCFCAHIVMGALSPGVKGVRALHLCLTRRGCRARTSHDLRARGAGSRTACPDRAFTVDTTLSPGTQCAQLPRI